MPALLALAGPVSGDEPGKGDPAMVNPTPTVTPPQPDPVSSSERRYGSVVRATAARSEPGSAEVSVDQARLGAGTGGDALHAVDSLPGVARPAPGAAQPVVWGAGPADTRVFIDGVPVPALYHAGGVRGIVNDHLVERIDLVPGGFRPDFGDALGGLVLLTTAPLPAEGLHGYVGADLLDASALLSAAIGSRLRIAAAARIGYLDKLAGALVPPDTNALFPIAGYDDWQAKATLALRADETLELLALGGDDRSTLSQPSSDPAAGRSEVQTSSFQRVALRYRNDQGGDTISVQPWVGRDSRHIEDRFGGLPAALDSLAWRYGLRASWRHRLSDRISLSVGLDWEGALTSLSRTGSPTLPPREGDVFVFGQAPSADVATDTWSTHIANAAPYIMVPMRFGRFALTAGLRIEGFLIEGSRLTPIAGATPPVGFTRLSVALDPRLDARLGLGSRVELLAAGGIYHQGPSPEDLSAVFGNPWLGPSRAFHATLGARARATSALSVEVEGFIKYLDGITVRSEDATPALAAALGQDGTGLVGGGQFVVRHDAVETRAGTFSGYATYTLSRSERRDHPGQPVRLFDYDQTHILALVAGWTFRGLSLGARLRWSTGMPRTPIASTLFDARDGSYQPMTGIHNSIRLPDFVQLDLRAGKTWTFSHAGLELYLDVQNVTNARNAEEITYSFDYSQRGYISGLPTLAILGARVTF